MITTPDGAPEAFLVAQVHPPGYVHAQALTEFAECVYFGLRRLGVPAFYRERPDRAVRAIVIGAHLLPAQALAALPANAILYNSEQVDRESIWLRGPYREALRTRPVWDYSDENIRRFAALGIESARHVPLGFVPELARIPRAEADIDVLFYGSVNERRKRILDALAHCGLKVVSLFGVYGAERDRMIARAKVVLSVHFYEAKIFEIVRAAYLFTNAKALVAECGPDTVVDAELRDAMCAVPYERLVDTCVELVHDTARRRALGEQAQRLFARRREEDILARALGITPPGPGA